MEMEAEKTIISSRSSKSERLSCVMRKMKPYLTMVSLQFGYAGMYVISLVSLNHGFNHYVLSVYRHVIALLVIAPFAFFLERKIRPKMTLPILARIMLLGFLEPVLAQNLYNVGMKYTSATFASATVNILPAITFIFALLFRLERLKLKKIHSKAKVIGSIITVGGAIVTILYKGPSFAILHGQQGPNGGGQAHHNSTSDQHWLTGTLLLLARCLGWSNFFILQSFTLKKYPAELSLTAWICFMGALEGGVVTLVMERDMNVWIIGWDSRLFAAAYSGVVCSAIAYYVQGIVMKERGPVFVTAFSPLCMIITAALGAFVLSEQVHLGSLIGSIVIVVGLYCLVWGKSKDPIGSAAPTEDELPITHIVKPIIVVTDIKAQQEMPNIAMPVSLRSYKDQVLTSEKRLLSLT